MIYKKGTIDMSLVQCPYEEEEGYIYITDEYTNNILKLAGYSDISYDDFRDLCGDEIFVDKLDPYALQSYSNAYIYAYCILNGRFELGEPAIATNARYSYLYARGVLNGRFELGEQIIATNSYFSYMYGRDVLNGRFELGESEIRKSAGYSYLYARDVLKGRFELGESTIATDGNSTKKYFKLTGVQL